MKNIESLTKIASLANLIKQSNKIAILTGAGISTDSGIPDFRSTQNSIWVKNKSREELMSQRYLEGSPKEFWPIYKEIFKMKLASDFEPNYGHLFLKELEDMGKEVKVFTQNVDGLHLDAGSSSVYEMHGSIKKARCPKCKKEFGLSYIMEQDIPRCDKLKNAKGDRCGFILHPNVVLFGGMIHHFKEAEEYSKQCDLMIVLGTSLNVSPVNLLPLTVGDARYKGKVAIINNDATSFDSLFNVVIHDSITDSCKALKSMLSEA
ncbi:NAD-dependent protein deacetylase [compost metagenome]